MADWTITPPAQQDTGWTLTPPASPPVAQQASGWQITPPSPEPDKPGYLGTLAKTVMGAPGDVIPQIKEQGGAAIQSMKDRTARIAADQEEERANPGILNLKGDKAMLRSMSEYPGYVKDAFNLATAPVSGAAEALISKPVSALSGGVLKPEDVDTAMMAMKPGKGKFPEFGPEGARPAGEAPKPGAEPAPEPPKPAPPEAEKPLPETDRPKVEEPGPVLDPPTADETTRESATRIDDGLYRLQKNATADKIEARQFLESLPEEVTDPELQKQAYREIEGKMMHPDDAFSPEVQKMLDDHLAPWREEEAQLFKEIHEAGFGKEAELPLDSNGYVHRVVIGKGSYMDAADAAGNQDPVLGGKSLSKNAPSLKPRQFFVIDDGKGNRTFIGKDEKLNVGDKVEGGTVKHATSDEVEANTPVRYHQNALINTVDNVLRLRRVKRNIDLLNDVKQQLGDRGLMMQFREGMNQQIPPHFQQIDIPQLRGWYADPKIAAVLKDFYNPHDPDFAWIGKVNRFLTGSLFFNPIIHAGNVWAHWAVGRGWDWLKPGAYRDLMKSGTKAIAAVVNQSDDYKRMLREGSGLLYGDVANQNFYKLMIEKMGGEQVKDPRTWVGIAKNLGFSTVADLVKWEYRAASKALWAVNDMFMLQRQFELAKRGMPIRDAIREAERDIPNYRIPSEVMGQRAVAALLKNPNMVMFGRYKYGQFKAYSEMIKPLVKGSGDERKEALGKLMVMGAMMFAAYPIVDKAIQKITGNKDAKAQRFGPFSVPDAFWDWTQDQKDFTSALGSVLTPAPAIQIANEVHAGRDWTGKDIINPESTPLGKTVQAGEYAASKIPPLQQTLQAATQPDSLPSVIARNFGIKLPTEKQASGREKGKRIEAGQARSRERKDPLEKIIKGAVE